MKTYTMVEFPNALSIILDSYYKDFPYDKKKTFPINISVQLQDDVFNAFTKDPSWMQRAQQTISVGIKKWLKLCNEAAKKAVTKLPADQKEESYFRYLNKEIDSMIKQFTIAAQKECTRIISEYQKEQDKLTEYRIKAAGKLAVTGVSTAGSIVLTVLTGGTAAPLFIIAMCRTAAGVVQEIAKLASTVDTTAKYVQGELKILSAFMQDSNYKLFEAREKFLKCECELDEAQAKSNALKDRIMEVQQRIGKKGKTKEQDEKNKKKLAEAMKEAEKNSKERTVLEKKIIELKKKQDSLEKEVGAPKGLFRKVFKDGRKSATELGLSSLSGVLGLETPSLANCDSHIDLHEVNIGKVSGLSHRLSVSLYGAMDKQKQTITDSKDAFAKARKALISKFSEIMEQNKHDTKKLLAAQEKALKQLDRARANYEKKITGLETKLGNLIERIITANQKVDESKKLNVKFRTSIGYLKKGVPDALKYTATVVSLGTGLAMGFGGGLGNGLAEVVATVGDATQGLIAEIGSIVIDELV
ncbi:hypothetical protein [Ereboglobus luteus]|uniref:Uncharacterized protein n=1 Tax=Ereboglobus luteus TaxID=1796921 RepID=A0A2U8E5E0_9BACT|nr:hypothetical protein [Ereboglobus luteus]AWI10030.1 hypothetical protein CKA38_12900 [Ereboglobus luteus]